VRNKATTLTTLIAKAYLHAYPDADLSLYNSGSIRIDDVLQLGTVTEYDVIKILPFGGELQLIQMPEYILLKVFDVGVKQRGFVNKEWLVANKSIDLNKNYKVAIIRFLVNKGDLGLKFLKFSENSELKLLTNVKIDVRKALINEFLLIK
jgi:5'-nucleotidase